MVKEINLFNMTIGVNFKSYPSIWIYTDKYDIEITGPVCPCCEGYGFDDYPYSPSETCPICHEYKVVFKAKELDQLLNTGWEIFDMKLDADCTLHWALFRLK